MPKMTVHEVLTAISAIRNITVKRQTLTKSELLEVDAKLLDLQERLLDDYGNEPQSTTL